jgi:ABC-2 type transport system ATP-binding protein
MATVIKTEGLSKSYGPIAALKDLDLEVQQGEIFGFLGPNGAGKTTTILLLTGFIRPTSGRATVLGYDAWKEPVKIREELGFLPDYPALYEHLTGEELLDYLMRLHTGREAVWRKELCARLELPRDALRRRIRGYSRGMRQKLAIIQALQHRPALLIMDEPTEGLDPLMQQSFYQIVLDFRRQGGTIFLSSHILTEVERLCQRVGIIRQGTLVTVDSVEELKARKIRTMQVTLTTEGAAPNFSLPCVVSVEAEMPTFRLRVKGDINPLLRELARHKVAELVYEQASLEDIFLEFYR